MTIPVTFSVALASALLAALFGWLGARPADPRRGVRMVPWRFLMIVCALVAFLMLVHLVNLYGVTTGRGAADFPNR
jgi:amino acid transporter